MEKSPFIKKSSEIKSYLDSRLCFLGLFSDSMPVWFYTKTSLGKKSYDIRKRMGTKDVYTNAKEGQLILKNTRMAIFKVQMRKKVFFMKIFLDLTSFSQDLGLFLGFFFLRIYYHQDFISCDLISWNFIDSPHNILGKKSRESKTQDFQWHFFQGLEKIRTFFRSFYFQVFISRFFPETFFPGTVLHRFLVDPARFTQQNYFFKKLH